MKTLRNLAAGLFAVLVAVLFTACPNPQGQIGISIDPAGNLTVKPGETVSWNVTLTPDSTQSSALGQFYLIADQDTVFQTDLQGATESQTFQVNLTIPDSVTNGQQINVTFVAVDAKSGLSSSLSVVLTVETEVYNDFQNITLNWNSEDITTQMMLVLSADGYSLADGNSTDGVVAYMYNGDADVLNTLASPNAQEIADAFSANGVSYDTSNKHETYFKRMSNLNWDDIDQATIDSLNLSADQSDVIANNANLGYGVSTLSVGDIVAFYNAATNTKGFIRVDNISTAKGTLIATNMTVDLKYVIGPSTTAK